MFISISLAVFHVLFLLVSKHIIICYFKKMIYNNVDHILKDAICYDTKSIQMNVNDDKRNKRTYQSLFDIP